jgi:rod shape determining protein RodA
MLLKWKRIDWSIIAILLLFGLVSTMLVYSATLNDPKGIHIPISRNVLNYAIGFFGMIAVTFVDFRIIVKISPYLYGIAVALLIAVYFFGTESNGARSWFEIPWIGSFQPAELMKIVLIIAVSAMMARRLGEKLLVWRDVIPIGIAVSIPFLLVVIQPDLGNAIIFLVILLGMYWIGNIKYTHVILGTAIIVGFLYLFYYTFTHYHEPIQKYLDAHGKGHWVERIDTFIDPQNASRDAKYQVEQSMIAIGSGSLRGDGFTKGNSVQQGFVPYAYSDSIFVVLGEEFGFIGAAVLLLLYFLLIYRMILIAIQTTDLAGSYLIVGIVSMFVFQIFENVGMLIGIMPLTGITLPFVSYGGTSLLINMVSIGFVLSIRLHQEEPSMFQET